MTQQNANQPAVVSTALASVLRDRTVVALALVCVFVVILGAVRRNDDTGMDSEAFWAMKSEWKNQADIVLLGDSRTLVGVSPAEMQNILPKTRILNYAFNALGYTNSYLEMVQEILDETSEQPAVVLGITPLSLTTSSAQDNGFLAYIIERNTSKLGSSFAELRQFFAPISTREIINTLGPENESFHQYRHYHPTGWLESVDVPEDPSESVASYSTMFRSDQRGQPRQDIEDLVINATSRWTAKGIRVFAFRPPTCEDMVTLETAEAHWDPADFIRRFGAAGGKWLVADESAYHSYDNSHLSSESAKRFSAWLASNIAADRENINSSP